MAERPGELDIEEIDESIIENRVTHSIITVIKASNVEIDTVYGTSLATQDHIPPESMEYYLIP